MIEKSLERVVIKSDRYGFLSEQGFRTISRSFTSIKEISREHYTLDIEDAAFFDDRFAAITFRRWGETLPVKITFTW
jgi:hypothetical protein